MGNDARSRRLGETVGSSVPRSAILNHLASRRRPRDLHRYVDTRRTPRTDRQLGWNRTCVGTWRELSLLLQRTTSCRMVTSSPEPRLAPMVGGSLRHVLTPWTNTRRCSCGDLKAEEPTQSAVVLREDIDSYSVSFDRRWTLSVQGDRIDLLDLHSEDPISSIRTIKKRGGNIEAHEISPNGRWMVTIRDGKAHLWDLNLSNPEAIALRFHDQSVTCIAMKPDNRWAVTGSADGTVCLWPLDMNALRTRARQRAGRTLSEDERRQFLVDNPP